MTQLVRPAPTLPPDLTHSGDETSVHVGFDRSAQVATYVDLSNLCTAQSEDPHVGICGRHGDPGLLQDCGAYGQHIGQMRGDLAPVGAVVGAQEDRAVAGAKVKPHVLSVVGDHGVAQHCRIEVIR